METLMQTIKATALICGFSIVAIAIIAIWILLMMRLLKSNENISAKEIENANVELEAGDWLLGIIKFGGIILCPIAFYFICSFIWDAFILCAWLWGFKNIDDILKAFIPAMFWLFFAILGVCAGFQWIKYMAKESAIERGNK